jgi:hypothetical protein
MATIKPLTLARDFFVKAEEMREQGDLVFTNEKAGIIKIFCIACATQNWDLMINCWQSLTDGARPPSLQVEDEWPNFVQEDQS